MTGHSRGIGQWFSTRKAATVFVVVLASVAAMMWLLFDGVLALDFLVAQANFEVSDALIRFSSTDANARAIAAGILNVVVVGSFASVLACVFAAGLTLLRLTGQSPLVEMTRAFVDIIRGVPLLLQIVALYFSLLALPPPNSATPVMDCLLLTNRGLYLPALTISGIECPALAGFRVDGGFRISIEMSALVLGLSVYAAAFLSEILRGALLAVPNGQWDAARALGLKPVRTFFLVILPQALVASIPPATSVFAGVYKNTSLGIAIGYSDLMMISNSIITITGRAFEMMAIVCIVFFVVNYSVNTGLTVFHQRLLKRYG